MHWANAKELTLDFFMIDKATTFDQLDVVFDSDIDQIGVACSCHLDFGKFCIFEVGQNVQRIVQRYPDGTLKRVEEPSEFSFDYEACVSNQLQRSRFDLQKSDAESLYCSEIDRSKEDVYSTPRSIESVFRDLKYGDFDISEHFIQNYPDYMDYLLQDWVPDEILDETHMGDLARSIFYQINDLRTDPPKWAETQSKNPLAVRELQEFPKFERPYLWSEGLARAARHIINDRSCGVQTDVYG